jgi:phosphoglucomutase
MWMRGSGTEPVFRVLCDVKGYNPQFEAMLLEAETGMLGEANDGTCYR